MLHHNTGSDSLEAAPRLAYRRFEEVCKVSISL